ncbi:hypothetical protein PO78_4278 [Thauera sp. SWB20]|nr:hypothetical protein PO78_4278 [Thauera sp. SWB20]
MSTKLLQRRATVIRMLQHKAICMRLRQIQPTRQKLRQSSKPSGKKLRQPKTGSLHLSCVSRPSANHLKLLQLRSPTANHLGQSLNPSLNQILKPSSGPQPLQARWLVQLNAADLMLGQFPPTAMHMRQAMMRICWMTTSTWTWQKARPRTAGQQRELRYARARRPQEMRRHTCNHTKLAQALRLLRHGCKRNSSLPTNHIKLQQSRTSPSRCSSLQHPPGE